MSMEKVWLVFAVSGFGIQTLERIFDTQASAQAYAATLQARLQHKRLARTPVATRTYRVEEWNIHVGHTTPYHGGEV